MDLRHLRYFIAVAEELHFARAAEKLGIAPPTLTVQIHELERGLQARLFDRNRRAVTLTYAGEVFLVEARETLARFERALLTGRRAGRGEIGGIEIGYVGAAVFSGALQREVSGFREIWPDVSVHARELPMATLAARVDDGTLDLGFVRMPVVLPPTVRSHVVSRDRYCVALPAGHRLSADEKPIRPGALSGESFIVPEQLYGTQQVGQRGGFMPDIVMAPGSLVSVLTQVSLGAGVAIVPDVLRGVVGLPAVVLKTLAGPPIDSDVSMLYRADERSPAALNLIRRILATEVSTPDPGHVP
jgi:DNA-binding transcriptional LysR family regulator